MGLAEKIKDKSLVIGVVGLGYVGLPLAVEIAKKNIKVIGYNRGQEKVDKINSGENYIQDVDDKELKEIVSEGYLSATCDFSRIPEADVVCIAVPTPIDGDKEPDLSLVIDATEKIGKSMRKGQLIILKSTTYPGTTEEEVLPLLERESKLKAGRDFYLAFAPERIDPGNEKFGTANTPKVVGGIDKESTKLAADFFRLFINSVHEVSSTRAAEMTKILENSFRLINISFINEMALICEKMNIDIWEVIDAAKTKPFGFMPFYPGPGLGGHCIPVDPYYLTYKAKEYDLLTRFINVASDIDDYMHKHVVDLAKKSLVKDNKKLADSKLLLLGVAYKKDINDLRESPALKVIDILKKEDISFDYYDPYVPEVKEEGENLKSISALTEDVIGKYDCIIILTDHSSVDYGMVLKAAPRIVDTRNAIKKKDEKVILI